MFGEKGRGREWKKKKRKENGRRSGLARDWSPLSCCACGLYGLGVA